MVGEAKEFVGEVRACHDTRTHARTPKQSRGLSRPLHRLDAPKTQATERVKYDKEGYEDAIKAQAHKAKDSAQVSLAYNNIWN
jgi:hypothetical protein